MDVDEAKAMIKGLRQAGLEAEQEQRLLDRDAKAARAKVQPTMRTTGLTHSHS